MTWACCTYLIILCVFYLHYAVANRECDNGQLHTNSTTNILYICVNGTWKTLCPRLWGPSQATVACRQLNPGRTVISEFLCNSAGICLCWYSHQLHMWHMTNEYWSLIIQEVMWIQLLFLIHQIGSDITSFVLEKKMRLPIALWVTEKLLVTNYVLRRWLLL